MPDTGTPPVIPVEFQIYNSYVEDPKWQRKFTLIWCSVLAFFVLVSFPRVLMSKGRRGVLGMFMGVGERWGGYERLDDGERVGEKKGRGSERRGGWVEMLWGRIRSVGYWSIPGIGLNAGQIFLLVAYSTTVILSTTLRAPLLSNSNRAGFLSLALLTPLFLTSSKSPILPLLLASSYDKLNYLHRWTGRLLFLCALLHGSMWINNHVTYGLPILGQQKEGSGVAAFGVLCVIVISSLRLVRRWWYALFYVVHMLTFPAFFITICYHTPYASPWIFAPIALYTFDVLTRLWRTRVKDAILVPVDEQFTLVYVPHANTHWEASQHLRVWLLSPSPSVSAPSAFELFQAHPLTALNAPPEISCLSEETTMGGLVLGVRAVGTWSRGVNRAARVGWGVSEKDEKPQSPHDSSSPSSPSPLGTPALLTLSGSHGGSSLDLGAYETVLLFAGGAGATFTLGLLDDIVGRCVRLRRSGGEVTRRVEFAWCVRGFGSIQWLTPFLKDIANVAASSRSVSSSSSGTETAIQPIDVHISIYVTCLCNPEAVPSIPNCDVTIVRPEIYKVLKDLATPPSPSPLPPSALSSKGKCGSSPSTPPSGETEIQYLPKAPSHSTAPTTAPIASSDDIDDNDDDDTELEKEIGKASQHLPWSGPGGGLALCACGPESLTREAANAVARLQMGGAGGAGREVGRVGLCTEVFTL